MKTETNFPEADALDSFLSGPHEIGDRLPAEEVELAVDILHLAAEMHFQPQPDPHLEQLIAARSRSRPVSRNRWRRLSLSFAGAAALVGLLVLAAPLLIRNPLTLTPPAESTPLVGTESAVLEQPEPDENLITLPRLAANLVAAEWDGRQEMGAVQFHLGVSLPQGPKQVEVLRQSPIEEELTPQSALQMASQLGVNGALHTFTGEAGDISYLVSDGLSSVLFSGASPYEFSYQLRSRAAAGPQPLELSFEDQAAIAIAWLEERGLLKFPYRVISPPADPSGVAILPAFNDGAFYLNNPYDPPILVQIG